MKIGIVGYQGCGKSTLFQWLTDVVPDISLSHTSQSAMAGLFDQRMTGLCDVYSPKKVTHAAMEIVDTPGLSRTHEGSAAKLAAIREAGCLVIVVSSFDGSDPLADLQNFEDDLLIADLEIVSTRVERLRQSIKKPRPNREQEQQELAIQRGELLEQIGGLPTRIGATNGEAAVTAPVNSTQPESRSAPIPSPKPAGGSTTSQFRKLRRDAKRRAIGA